MNSDNENDRISEDILRRIIDKGYWTGISEGWVINIPYLWEVQKWLREKKEISVEPYSTAYKKWGCNVKTIGEAPFYMNSTNVFDTYEKALKEGITIAIRLL